MSDAQRYSRQTLVEQIGSSGQAHLESASVLIVGAGGLGCTVAAQLVGAGVGSIELIDHDQIDLSNLHRQILFREQDVGKPKAEIAARELTRINSACRINWHSDRLGPGNANLVANGKTVIVDAADNFVVSYILSDVCTDLAIPLISASVNRTFGYIGQFCGGAPSFRAVFPRLPIEQESCDTVGVTGPSVGAIASIQAQEVIKAIIGDSSQLKGKLLYLDLWNYSQRIVDFNNAVNPRQNQIELISVIDITESDYVIDVRESEEALASPHEIAGLHNIPMAQLEHQIPTTAKEFRVVCICKSGQRALAACQILVSAGFYEVAAVLP